MPQQRIFRRLLFCVAFLTVPLAGSFVCGAEKPTRNVDARRLPTRAAVATKQATPANVPRRTMIVAAVHLPVSKLVTSLVRWSSDEEKTGSNRPITAVPVEGTNRMLISGTAQQLDSVREVLKALDQPTPQLRIRLVIARITVADDAEPANAGIAIPQTGDLETTLRGLAKLGHVRVLARPELTVHDNSESSVQMGARVPRIVGTTTTSRSTTNSVSMENVGTMLKVSAHATDTAHVVVDIDLEYSGIGDQEEGTPVSVSGSRIVRTPALDVMTLTTTASAPVGKTVVLGGIDSTVNGKRRRAVALLQVDILR